MPAQSGRLTLIVFLVVAQLFCSLSAESDSKNAASGIVAAAEHGPTTALIRRPRQLLTTAGAIAPVAAMARRFFTMYRLFEPELGLGGCMWEVMMGQHPGVAARLTAQNIVQFFFDSLRSLMRRMTATNNAAESRMDYYKLRRRHDAYFNQNRGQLSRSELSYYLNRAKREMPWWRHLPKRWHQKRRRRDAIDFHEHVYEKPKHALYVPLDKRRLDVQKKRRQDSLQDLDAPQNTYYVVEDPLDIPQRNTNPPPPQTNIYFAEDSLDPIQQNTKPPQTNLYFADDPFDPPPPPKIPPVNYYFTEYPYPDPGNIGAFTANPEIAQQDIQINWVDSFEDIILSKLGLRERLRNNSMISCAQEYTIAVGMRFVETTVLGM